MHNKSFVTVVVILFISIALSSCVRTKTSGIGVPGIRQVDKFDGEVHISTSHQKYDNITEGWYEAEKNSAGEWDFTSKGKKDKEEALKRQLSGGGGSGGGGGGGGGGCFTAETKVLMGNGELMLISDIQIGSEVMGYDFESKQFVSTKVEKIYELERDHYYRINGSEGLGVTGEHPFYVGEHSLKEVKDLHEGDAVLGDAGGEGTELESVTIETVQKVLKETKVYNMTVGGVHNFIVVDQKKNRFFVHNKGGGGSG